MKKIASIFLLLGLLSTSYTLAETSPPVTDPSLADPTAAMDPNSDPLAVPAIPGEKPIVASAMLQGKVPPPEKKVEKPVAAPVAAPATPAPAPVAAAVPVAAEKPPTLQETKVVAEEMGLGLPDVPSEGATAAAKPAVPAATPTGARVPSSDGVTPQSAPTEAPVYREPVPLMGEKSATPPSMVSASPTAQEPNREKAELAALPAGAEVSIILAHNQFFPSRVRLKEGQVTKLFFTTIQRKPAALILDRLNVQRWLGKEDRPGETPDHSSFEINREISTQKMTEVTLDPHKGIYTFHDALSGASGEIVVE